MEQILIRDLPAGTLDALQSLADRRGRTVEEQAREIVIEALELAPPTLVDLLASDEGADIDFEPGRLSLAAPRADDPTTSH